jgi:hypothetical protein
MDRSFFSASVSGTKGFLRNSNTLSISFLIIMNRDFGEKIPFNNLFNWLFKYNHLLIEISHEPKIENENDSLECK